jgi:D-sedoheptulose 7-phosphate isomerase
MSIANDISYEDIFVEQLKNFLHPGDVVIGISGSGNSVNIVKPMQYAKEAGAVTVAFCGYSGGKIKHIADLSIHADVHDMEVAEDIHGIVFHAVKQVLRKKLNSGSYGEKYDARIDSHPRKSGPV